MSHTEGQLQNRGWKSKTKESFLSAREQKPLARGKESPRFEYHKGDWVILTENKEHQFLTLQKKCGSEISWYVDFPLGIEIEKILTFIELM